MDANSSAVAAAPPKSSEDNTEIQVLSKKDRPAQTPKQISTPESSIQTHEGGAASPAQIAVSSSGVRQIATGPILFNTGLAELRPVSFNTLDEVAGLLKANRNMRLAIVGHTDNLGPEKGNVELSAARAEAVKGYLVSKGIEPSRLEFKGMGSKSPIASNDTKLGRQANRRIEFLVTSPK